jgi:redox-sensing transcriptional repressor
MSTEISSSTVRRLATYYRVLNDLREAGEAVASSMVLAERSGVTPAQVRKDLSYFGHFGKRGLGYDIAHLAERIRSILGLDRRWRVGLVGAGNVGSALFSYEPFQSQGFDIVAIFDSDPDKVGRHWDGLIIHPIAEFAGVVRDTGIDIAVLAVPARVAQQVADLVVEAGIRAILNFAPCRLDTPSGVALRNVDMAAELESLSFALRAERGASD